MKVAGLDIGGTKCAVTLGVTRDSQIQLLDKSRFPTEPTPEGTMARMIDELERLLERNRSAHDGLQAIGISCGGPLDSRRGVVLSPPNLLGWDRVDVVSPLRRHFGVPVGLQNDANACALAEWQWGAGRGTRNMVFLTFGTGMGAGLILDGRLYGGTNDNAGEVGHIRMADTGPIGYNKIGSFEGYCSGGGIARLAQLRVLEQVQAGGVFPAFCDSRESLQAITAKEVAEAAHAGDPLAAAIFREVGRYLGRGLSILIDVLNPEKIVIGSIYARQRQLLEPSMLEELRRETIPGSLAACEIVPADLGEQVGDYAALSVARMLIPE